MVNGLDSFREHFAAYADRYVLIGGPASSLAMEELGEAFRVTKDLDIVLCVEALDRTFVESIWEFVKLGGYENRQKSTGKRMFYRFYTPAQADYPSMLELFSRVPDALDLKDGAVLTPIPVAEDVSSLSAILMDEGYYRFVMEHRKVNRGLSVIGADVLIPLKARAYMDLSSRKARGEAVDSRDIKKHKNDIFRLFTVLDRQFPCSLPGSIRDDLAEAFENLKNDVIDLKSLGISDMPTDGILAALARFYQMNSS